MGIHQYDLTWLDRMMKRAGIATDGCRMCELGNQWIRHLEIPAKRHFSSLGCAHTSIDTNGKDGALKLDLGGQLPLELRDAFDVVTNFGTSEHVNGHDRCMENIAWLARPGGLIVHVLPAEGSWPNHGLRHYTRGDVVRDTQSGNHHILDIHQFNRGRDGTELIYLAVVKGGGSGEVTTWKPMKTAVYTTITGGFDHLMPHAETAGVDHICFTDLPRQTSCRGWSVRRIPNLSNGWDPRTTAKWAKVHPHLLLPEYDLTIFVDGNKQIIYDLRTMIDEFCESCRNLGLYHHPQVLKTGRIKQLHEEIEGLTKGKCRLAPEILEEQFRTYLGLNPGCGEWPVYAGFVLFRTNIVDGLMEEWWEHLCRWPLRDQPSLAYLLGTGNYPSPHVFDVANFGSYFVRYTHGTENVRQYHYCAYHIPKELRAPW